MQQLLKSLHRFGLVVLIVLAFLLASNNPNATAIDAPETWFDLSGSPTLEKSWDLSSTQFASSVTQGYKPQCMNAILLKRAFSIGIPIWQQTVDRCWYSTSLGLLAQGDNYLLGNDSLVAGPVAGVGSGAYLRPTAHDNTFVEIKSNSSQYIKFHYGAKTEASYGLLGIVTNTLSSDDTLLLKASTGANVTLSPGQGFNYSPNGKWATGVTVNYAMFRINLETKQILNFGEPIHSGFGWNPFMAVSITNDGKYAVAAGTAPTGGQWMRIYDLNDCQDGEHDYVSLTHANCKYRDLTSFLQSNIPNFNRFTMAEFGDNDTLVFYHYTAGSDRTYTRYVLRAPNSSSRIKDYIALGDSYASGEGAYSYFKGTDEGPDVNNCHLSRLSYPYLLGAQLQLDSYHSVACSGAVSRNVIGPESNIDDTLIREDRTNQYKRNVPDNELGSWIPGYFPQLNFAKQQPNVITISMIGNDIGFGSKVKRCLEPDTCYSTYEDRLEILLEVRSKYNLLTNVYAQLLQAAGPSAKIYVVGYPKISNPDGNCAVNVRLNSSELQFANQLVEELNNVIKSAAGYAGVGYVNIEDALAGHVFCDDTDQMAINGLTAGNDVSHVVGNESYHPNAYGHRLLAEAIRASTNDFGLLMPAPDSSISAPSQEDDLPFLNMPKSGREIRTANYDVNLTNDVVYRETWWNVTYKSVVKIFNPSTLIKIVLHSDPVDLGSIAPDEHGTIDAPVKIPANVPTGFHTLHLYGKDLDGNDLDVYKIIYVANTPSDKNGDGVDDNSQPCGVFLSVNQDTDSDGIDDGCDAEIISTDSTNQIPNSTPSPSSNSAGDGSQQSEQTDISPYSTNQPVTNGPVAPDSYTPSVLGLDTDMTKQPSQVITTAQNHSYLYFYLAAGVTCLVMLTLLWRLGYARVR